jgi:hypothetical protein
MLEDQKRILEQQLWNIANIPLFDICNVGLLSAVLQTAKHKNE